ncbi:hypothetical protein CPB97_000281 [Podila verticillata]|nr:hypothetical protein CPB97_000281 [Podila verticillata]
MKHETEEYPSTLKDVKNEGVDSDIPVSSSLESLSPNPTAKTHRLFWIFIVNEGISYISFITYLLACFGTICLIVYLSIIQNYVLTVILRIRQNTGNLTGSLALYDEIIAMPATLVWGILSDRIGRRYVYGAGFACIGVSLICYSYVKNVYPHMLLCRLLFSLGTAACTCMMTGTLGDVAGGKHERGRVGAMVGMFAGFGGLVGGMVLTKVPYQLEKIAGSEVGGIHLCFRIVGGVAIGFAFFAALTMTKLKKSQDFHGNPFTMLKYGFLAARDPRIALAYMSSFVARADTVLFTSFMSLWVIHWYMKLGYCMPDTSCQVAAGDTHPLTGMGQGVSLAFAPIFAIAGEYFRKSTVLSAAGIIGAAGAIPFAFTKLAPSHKSNYVFVCMVGIGQIGMIVTGMSMVNGVYVDPKYRGSVAGVFSFCGAVSIMVMAKLGGYLFDVWMWGAPFVLMGIVHSIIALFAIYVRLVSPRLEEEDRKRLIAQGIEVGEFID